MSSLFLSFLVVIVFCFHVVIRRQIKHGRVKEGFLALWCIDAVFSVSSTAVSFALYDYRFLPFFTWRNILACLLFLFLTALFILISPSGLTLFHGQKNRPDTDILMAEYRFNDTLCFVRSFFMTLLFSIPILMTVLLHVKPDFWQLIIWKESDICGAFCFISFLFLVPLSLRQTLFWLRNLFGTPLPEEEELLMKYRTDVHFLKHNFRI